MELGQFKGKKDTYRVYSHPSFNENGWNISTISFSGSQIINDYEYYNKTFKILKTEYVVGDNKKEDIYLIQFSDGVKFVIEKDEIEEIQYQLPEELFEIEE